MKHTKIFTLEDRQTLLDRCGPETAEAYDVLWDLHSAAQFGLELEWMETFIQELRQGKTPQEAMFAANREWDIYVG